MGTSTTHVEDEKDTTNNQVTFLKIFLFVKESFIPNMFCNMFLRTRYWDVDSSSSATKKHCTALHCTDISYFRISKKDVPILHLGHLPEYYCEF